MKTSMKRMLLGLLSIIALTTALWLIHISLQQSGQNLSPPKKVATPVVYTELPAAHLSSIGINYRQIEEYEASSIVSNTIYTIFFALIGLSMFGQLCRYAIERHKRKTLQNLKKGEK